MWIGVGVALLSVATGAAIGLLPQARRQSKLWQRVAVVSAVVFVALRVVPETLVSHGVLPLAVLGVAFILPSTLSGLVTRIGAWRQRDARMSSEFFCA